MAHSRTPQVIKTAKGFLVTWIEEPVDSRAGIDSEAGLRIAEVDANGLLLSPPRRVHGADDRGTVTASAVVCSPEDCHGVLTSELEGVLTLGAFETSVDGVPGPVRAIATLTGPGSEDASPALVGAGGTSLFFADDSVGGSGRVRWMRLQWR